MRFVAVLLCCACAPSVRIAPSPGLPKPDCTAPDVVDGEPVTPVALGDSVTGDGASGEKLAFCAKPGTWVQFKFDASRTVQQPILPIDEGSSEIAENRFYGLEADKASQLLVPDDGIYVLAPQSLDETLPAQYGLSFDRPGSNVVVVDDHQASIALGQEVYGAFASDDDVHEVSLPALDHDGVLTIQAALSGYFGNGATATPLVDVIEGGAVVASLDFTDKLALTMPVAKGAQLSLQVHSAGFAGERPFYALEQVAVTDDAPVVDVGGNDDITTAQALTLDASSAVRTATVALSLSAGDVDWFSFPANAHDTIHFSCAAESAGSGLRALDVDLRDATGTLLFRAAEKDHDHQVVGGTRTWMDAADASALDVAAGTYYAQVSAGSFATGIDGSWALCTASASPN